MTPVARLVLTFFAAFPVQRALITVVALGSVAATGFALASAPPSASRWLAAGAFVATLFSALVTLPCFMACGTLFAALSAPRTFLLLPHFRRRMLAAVLVVFVVGALPVVALVGNAPFPGFIQAVLGYGFAFFTFLVLASTLPPTALGLAPLVVVPALFWLGTLEVNVTALVLVVPAALAAASAAGWAVFAGPYLRGKPIVVRLPVLRDMLDGSRQLPSDKLPAWQLWSADTSAEALTRNAVAVVLGGRLPERPRRRLAMLAASVVVVALWLSVLLRVAPRLSEAPLFLLPFVVVPLNAFVAARAMRRARLLWLLGPERTALFFIVEKTAVRPFVAFGAGLAAVTFAFGVWHDGLPPASAALVAAALVAYGALAAYVGLLFVRGFGWAALLAALVYAGLFEPTLVLAAAAAEQGPALAGSAAFALAAAAACRYAALRRWRGIDWIALRPPRGASQRTRAAGV